MSALILGIRMNFFVIQARLYLADFADNLHEKSESEINHRRDNTAGRNSGRRANNKSIK